MGNHHINRVSVTPISGTYPHEIGANAFLPGRSRVGVEWLVRAHTNGGLEGLTIANRFFSSNGTNSVEELMHLLREVFIGRQISDLLEISNGEVIASSDKTSQAFKSYGWMSILGYDLVAKELGVSCVDLLGGPVRDRVDAYDTTLYFDDITDPVKGIDAVIEEARESYDLGWRQFKIKVGRGGRWMEPEAGARRDAAVVQGIRQNLGPDATLMVDANFGYGNRIDLLELFLRETLSADIYWLEEMIPPSVEGYRELRELQKRVGSSSLLVCGEVDREPVSKVYVEMANAGVFDAYQPDIVSQGFSGWKEIEKRLSHTEVKFQPHCFGNGKFGTRTSLIYGAATDRFISIEDERIECRAYMEDKFVFEKGQYCVSDASGLGIKINDEEYERSFAQNKFELSL